MPLSERVNNPNTSYPRTPCSIGQLLKDLPPAEAKALKKMLDAPWRVWPHTAIEAALRDEGHPFGDQMVGKHRRSQCSCAKPKKAAA
jgi:hypothetical protein